MKDCENKYIKEGDKIAFTNVNTAYVMTGKVIGFTLQMIKIKASWGGETRRFPAYVCVVQ